MDLTILKKKLSTFRTESGRLTKVSDELLVEILNAWEEWVGPASGFYSGLGADHRKMASLIGRAKKLKREGHFPAEVFKEIKIEGNNLTPRPGGHGGIEVVWEQDKVIRFSHVSQLLEFLAALRGNALVVTEDKAA